MAVGLLSSPTGPVWPSPASNLDMAGMYCSCLHRPPRLLLSMITSPPLVVHHLVAPRRSPVTTAGGCSAQAATTFPVQPSLLPVSNGSSLPISLPGSCAAGLRLPSLSLSCSPQSLLQQCLGRAFHVQPSAYAIRRLGKGKPNDKI